LIFFIPNRKFTLENKENRLWVVPFQYDNCIHDNKSGSPDAYSILAHSGTKNGDKIQNGDFYKFFIAIISLYFDTIDKIIILQKKNKTSHSHTGTDWSQKASAARFYKGHRDIAEKASQHFKKASIPLKMFI
jgi:hypothetical protein